jgi:hypothetical protein
VHRSLQTQALTWLAALATIVAVAVPSTDRGLFAAALLLGAVLANAREHVAARRGKLRVVVGDAIGATLAWAFVAARAGTRLGALVPTKLTVGVCVVAAVLPTIAFLMRAGVAARARWTGRIEPELEDLEDLDL